MEWWKWVLIAVGGGHVLLIVLAMVGVNAARLWLRGYVLPFMGTRRYLALYSRDRARTVKAREKGWKKARSQEKDLLVAAEGFKKEGEALEAELSRLRQYLYPPS